MNKKMNAVMKQEQEELCDSYREAVANAQSLDEVLQTGVDLQREMEEIIIRYRQWDDSWGYDHVCIYYTANFIVENSPLEEIRALDSEDKENRKERLAALLFTEIDQGRKKRIHVIEPHPDDMLGSASSLCYCTEAFVTLHTISRVFDGRRFVLLDQENQTKYKSIRKRINVVKHCKYEIEDLDWNKRCLDKDPDYAELLQSYIEMFGDENFEKLTECIRDIVKAAREEDAYLALPLGIEHPMHMLTTYACIEQINKQRFDPKKAIVYVDHPYDYLNVGTGRLQKAREYIQSKLGMELCRCDDISIDQSILKDVITEVYGDTHYGEFANSLENTFCSYYVDLDSLNEIKKFMNLHVNNILYITDQAKPFKKTGGLGEVAYVLCKTLQDFVNDVRILIPKYSGKGFQDVGEKGQDITFKYQGSTEAVGEVPCAFTERRYDGLTYYLLDIKGYFGSTNPLDTGKHGLAYTIFCDAVIQGLKHMDYVPSVLHCNDWQTALIPMLKKTKYSFIVRI